MFQLQNEKNPSFKYLFTGSLKPTGPGWVSMSEDKINSISKYHINNNLRRVHFDTFNKALQLSMNNECNLKHFPRRINGLFTERNK